MGYLKTINMQLATFVLAVIQITKDILWFLLILLAAIMAFSQMFYTLLLPTDCADYDASEQLPSHCKLAEYYLRVYTVLLGDFGDWERDDFHTPLAVTLIVLFSFMVVIVLLNVLIAIVSDSYEKCLIRSQYLFGRARVMILAELISFQNLLRKDNDPLPLKKDDSGAPSWNIVRRMWMAGRSRRWSRGSLVFFTISASSVLIWFIGEMAGYASGQHYGDIKLSLGSIIVNVAVLLVVVAFLSQRMSGLTDSSPDSIQGFASCWYKNSIQRLMVLLLGTSETASSKDTDREHSDVWRGRALFVQREMERIASESRSQNKAEMKALDGKLYSEMSALERRVLESEALVMAEVKASERRIEATLQCIMVSLDAKETIANDGSLLRSTT